MINSRKLEDLLPVVSVKAAKFLDKCQAEGIEILITSTFRDNESQNELYAQGRTKTGDIVTNAKGGQSMHNYRCAFDIVPMRGGKPVWGTKGTDGELWQRLGAIGESCGLEWGGHWKGKLCDMPHFQYTGGLSLNDLMAGKKVQ